MLLARKCSRVGRVIVMEMRSICLGGWVSFGGVVGESLEELVWTRGESREELVWTRKIVQG